MAKQIINIGQTPNDRTGDPLRSAFEKINGNFDELYQSVSNLNVGTDVELDGGGAATVYDLLGLNIDGGVASTIYSTSNISINGGGAQ
jgi:hypothetical protein